MMYREQIIIIASFFIIKTSGSALYGKCLTHDDCGTIDTYCLEGICKCAPNFAELFDSCIPLANPRIPCKRKHDCHNKLGIRSMCTRAGECACKPFHHLHNGQCVKNRDLHDICEHDHQCYCGDDCGDKIACLGRNCTCTFGNKPYKTRRCIADISVLSTLVASTASILTSSTILVTVLLLVGKSLVTY